MVCEHCGLCSAPGGVGAGAGVGYCGLGGEWDGTAARRCDCADYEVGGQPRTEAWRVGGAQEDLGVAVQRGEFVESSVDIDAGLAI